MGDSMPVYPMVLLDVKHILIHDLIMTEPAWVSSTLADRIGTLQLTGSQIMFAAKFAFFECDFFVVESTVC